MFIFILIGNARLLKHEQFRKIITSLFFFVLYISSIKITYIK